MFRSLVLGFLTALSKPLRDKIERADAQVEAAKPGISLTDRSQEKIAAIKEWSKPENIVLRMKEQEELAPLALEAGKKLAARIKEEFNIPDDIDFDYENVPKHMRGQSPSTIRAMLRHEYYYYDRELKLWSPKDV